MRCQVARVVPLRANAGAPATVSKDVAAKEVLTTPELLFAIWLRADLPTRWNLFHTFKHLRANPAVQAAWTDWFMSSSDDACLDALEAGWPRLPGTQLRRVALRADDAELFARLLRAVSRHPRLLHLFRSVSVLHFTGDAGTPDALLYMQLALVFPAVRKLGVANLDSPTSLLGACGSAWQSLTHLTLAIKSSNFVESFQLCTLSAALPSLVYLTLGCGTEHGDDDADDEVIITATECVQEPCTWANLQTANIAGVVVPGYVGTLNVASSPHLRTVSGRCFVSCFHTVTSEAVAVDRQQLTTLRQRHAVDTSDFLVLMTNQSSSAHIYHGDYPLVCDAVVCEDMADLRLTADALRVHGHRFRIVLEYDTAESNNDTPTVEDLGQTVAALQSVAGSFTVSPINAAEDIAVDEGHLRTTERLLMLAARGAGIPTRVDVDLLTLRCLPAYDL